MLRAAENGDTGSESRGSISTSSSVRISTPPGVGSRAAPGGLSRRASLNTVAASLDYGAFTTVELVVNPLLVGVLGGYLYGAWRVLWKLTGYLWATSGRSAPALQVALANRQHTADEDEKRRYVGCAIVVWFVFLPLLAAVGALGAWFAPTFLRVSPEHVGTIRFTSALLVADGIALTLLTLPRAVLQGENLGYKRMGLSSILILAGGVLTMIAMWAGTGMPGVAGAHLLSTIITGVVFWRIARKYVPWFGVARPDRALVRRFFGLSWWFTAWKFVNELMTAGDVVVLGLFAPLELVAVYSLTKYGPDALSGLLSKPLQGIGPGLGGIIGSGDPSRAARTRTQFMCLTWLVTVGASTSILTWNRSFVDLWVGSHFYSGSLATLLIVVMALQFVLIRNDAYVIDLTLHMRAKVLLGLLSTTVSFALGAVLVAVFDTGIIGLCVGFIAGRSILSIAYPRIVGRALDHRLIHQVRGALRPAAVTVILFAIGTALASEVTVRGWIPLILASGTTGVVATVIAAFAGLTGTQRRFLLQKIRSATRKPTRVETTP